MTRWWLVAITSLTLWSQVPKPVEEIPPEEDAEFKTKEYTLNPLQSKKEFETGQYYWRRGSFDAARMRWEESVKWDAGNSEALFHLGMAQEKTGEKKAARETWAKYQELFPQGKRLGEVKKKLQKR